MSKQAKTLMMHYLLNMFVFKLLQNYHSVVPKLDFIQKLMLSNEIHFNGVFTYFLLVYGS